MTDAQLGAITALFDQIKAKVTDGSLELGFVRSSLVAILEGPKGTPLPPPSGKFSLRGKFSVIESPRVEELRITQGKYSNRVEGYQPSISSLGPFFFRTGSAETQGGTAGIIISKERRTIWELVGEVLPDVPEGSNTEGALIERGISFSLIQVLEVLKQGLIEQTVGKTKRSSVFLVHNGDKTGVAAISIACTKKDLFGKDLDQNYAYAVGTNFIVRTIPDHLRT